MSALVCRKRSFFEEVPATSLVSKRHCSSSSTSRICLSPSPRTTNYTSITNHYNPFRQSSSSSAALDRLRAIFSGMDDNLIERVLEEESGDIEAAIKRLSELSLDSAKRAETDSPSQEINACVVPSYVDSNVINNLPKNGGEWVEAIVNEMRSASDLDDARIRASKVLEVLEKSIRSQAEASTGNMQQENTTLKEQIEVVTRENGILKRAVAIQHERHKEANMKNQEVEQLKQVVAQYQERLRTLEVNNYALEMHLRQAQPINPINLPYNRDVF